MKRNILVLSIVVFLLACVRAGLAEPITVSTELKRMRSADHLYRPQNHYLRQYSGFHRKGGNPDRMHCLYTEKGWRVFADHKGPGVVTRIWTTHNPAWSDIQIEVDGKVIFSGRADKFFGQNKLPFINPLTEIRNNVSKSTTAEKEAKGKKEWAVTYVPIPFEKRFRYMTRKKVYSNINVKELDKDAEVESFLKADWKKLEPELHETAAVWKKMDLLGDSRDQYKHIERSITIPGGKKDSPAVVDVATLAGPGIIREIRIKPKNPKLNGKVDLRIYWDDDKQPSINSPLDQGFGSREHRTLAFGQSEDGRRFCRLPMPFKKKATVELVSHARKATSCDVEILVEENATLPDDVLYLRSYANEGFFPKGGQFEKPGLPLKDFFYHNGYKAFETQGSGHIVAYMDLFHCQPELDEHVYIDGERTFPDNRWNGTGHEDLFDMAWGHSPVSAPMTSGGSECFREANVKLFWNTPMAFRKSIRFNWEWCFLFGRKAPRDARFASVVYWYGKP